MRRTRRAASRTQARSRTTHLKGRAAALRKVAGTIDIWSIRDRVLALAEECVQLARLMEKEGFVQNSEPRVAHGSRSRRRP